jgi:hypothetical protein
VEFEVLPSSVSFIISFPFLLEKKYSASDDMKKHKIVGVVKEVLYNKDSNLIESEYYSYNFVYYDETMQIK